MNSALPFRKMHGLGNDFVVLDGRVRALELSGAAVRAIADRRTGVGFDQLLILEPPRSGGDVYLAIRNSDGGVTARCGNGERCVARLLMNETGKTRIVIETATGPTIATHVGDLISVDMGSARTEWDEIPLAEKCDTLRLDIREGALIDPVAVSMGNPHAVFFVPDVTKIDLATLGPKLEHHPLFPERANIEIVGEAPSRTHLRMRVWERGAGITRACGTGACAVAVAAARRGLAEREVTVTLDGGDLRITWRNDGHVIMTGPTAESFSGTLDPSLLSAQ